MHVCVRTHVCVFVCVHVLFFRKHFFLLGKQGTSNQSQQPILILILRNKLILHYVLFKQVYAAEDVGEEAWGGLRYLLVLNLSSFLKKASSKNFLPALQIFGSVTLSYFKSFAEFEKLQLLFSSCHVKNS